MWKLPTLGFEHESTLKSKVVQWGFEDLQISDTGLSFVAGGERILVEWPQAVDSTIARASYSSRSSKLVVKVKAQ